MKKKIFGLLVVLLMVLFVSGCGSDDKKKEDETNNKVEETNQVEETTDNGSNDDLADIELYSDDTKIVYKNEQGRAVYYYSGDKITAYHVYIDYGTAANARVALSIINNEENETIESAHVDGKYLVIVYDKSTYETLDVKTLRMVYSYLEELKKQLIHYKEIEKSLTLAINNASFFEEKRIK